MRRRYVAAAAAAVLGLTAACGAGGDADSDGAEDRAEASAAPYERLADVPEKLAEDGTTIVVGDPDAPVRVHLYEDLRCPVCEEFETTGAGPALRGAVVARKASAHYTLASFLDDRMGGGSKRAVNALRAALDEGRFAEYHKVLYAHQPEEVADGYTEAYLLELAEQVEGLRGPAFDDAVRTMKYRSFVTASEQAYERAGGEEAPNGPGTPNADVNEVRIPEDYRGVLFDGELFISLLRTVYAQPWAWGEHAFR